MKAWFSTFDSSVTTGTWPLTRGVWTHSVWTGTPSATISVTSQAGRCDNAGNGTQRHQPDSEAFLNGELRVTFFRSSNTRHARLYARSQTPTADPGACYYVALDNSGGTSRLRILKRDSGGTVTQLATTNIASDFDTGGYVAFRVTQTPGGRALLQAKVWVGEEIEYAVAADSAGASDSDTGTISYCDDTSPIATTAGYWGLGTETNPSGSVTYDDFRMDDFASGPAVMVQVAFQNSAFPFEVLWTDVTQWIRSEGISISRGRQTELEQPQPGEVSFTLDNRDRRFDPFNTSSPYYPYVEPMKQVRVFASYGSSTYALFRGYVDTWTQSWKPPTDAIVDVRATDGFKVLANYQLPDSSFSLIMQSLDPTSWWRLGESQTATAAIDQMGSNDGEYQNSPTLGTDGLVESSSDTALQVDRLLDQRMLVPDPSLISGYPFSFGALIKNDVNRDAFKAIVWAQNSSTDFSSGAFYIAIWGSDPGSSPADGRISITLYHDASNYRNSYGTIEVDDNERHHLLVVFEDATTWHIYIDGVEDSLTTTGSGTATFPDNLALGYGIGNSPKLSFGDYGFSEPSGTLDEVAIWDGTALTADDCDMLHMAALHDWEDDTSGERIEKILDCVDWPSDLRDIDDGNSTLQKAHLSGTVLDYLLKVALSENGSVYFDGRGFLRFRERHAIITESRYTDSQATFDDNDYVDVKIVPSDTFIRNEVSVQREFGLTITAKDDASQTRYLKRGYSRTGMLGNSDTEVRDAAEWLLAHYKDPIQRVDSITINPYVDNALWDKTLGRELEERITVTRQPLTGSAIEVEAHIESIQHSIGLSTWTTTWKLSPADAQSYLVLDDATLGQLDENRLAY